MNAKRSTRVKSMIFCVIYTVFLVLPPHMVLADSLSSCSGVNPQRIVVFPLYAEEILFGLVEPERIIYVGHKYDESGVGYWPTMSETQAIPGASWENIDEEEILSLQPDLLIFDSYLEKEYADIFPYLSSSKIPTLFLNSPRSVDEIKELIILLGDVVHKQEEALSMAKEMVSTMAHISELVGKLPEHEQKTVALYEEPNAFFNIVTDVCGIKGVYCCNEKALLEANPDIIVILPYCIDGGFLLDIGKEYSDECVARLKSEVLLSEIAAIASNDIYVLNFHGSQYISDCAMRLLKIVYPSLLTR